MEGNTTFYAVPSQDTVKRWAAQTPPEFKFCLKLPRNITHNGLLKPLIKDALKFAEIMSPLGSRLAPIFAQLPPSYAPSSLNDLTAFIESWQQTQLPLAIEFRHRDWFKQPYSDHLTNLLQEFGIGKVIVYGRMGNLHSTMVAIWNANFLFCPLSAGRKVTTYSPSLSKLIRKQGYRCLTPTLEPNRSSSTTTNSMVTCTIS